MTFYRSTIESVLAFSITVWYAGSTVADRKRLQRVIKSAEKTIGSPLHPLDDIASSRCISRTRRIIRDHLHPGHHLLSLLPSGRRYRRLKSRINRLNNRFFPWAIKTLDIHKNLNRHTYTSLSIKCNMLMAFYILYLSFTSPVLVLFFRIELKLPVCFLYV